MSDATVFDTPQIQLSSPEQNHFEAFVVGNATMCDHVVEPDSAAGQHIVICGAGPSLTEHAAEWIPQADQVWGCNSALTWLLDHGHRATHGFCIDQTAHMLTEWASAPDVEYLLASTVHPHLTTHLLAHQRRVRFYHNYVGIRKPPVETEYGAMLYEDWLYSSLYSGTIRAGSGLNAVSRAIDVAEFTGAARITVLGADCALRVRTPMGADVERGSAEHMRWLREETVMHADGGHALASGATPITFTGEIDGRRWDTKPDLMITAVTLAKMVRRLAGRLVLIGDTLPNALADKDDAFFARLPTLTNAAGEPIPT